MDMHMSRDEMKTFMMDLLDVNRVKILKSACYISEISLFWLLYDRYRQRKVMIDRLNELKGD